MCLKTMRLTTIRNGPNRTISASGGLELLQMVSELVTGWCEALVRVGLDPLHNRRVLKL